MQCGPRTPDPGIATFVEDEAFFNRLHIWSFNPPA